MEKSIEVQPKLIWSGRTECNVTTSLLPQSRLLPLEFARKNSRIEKKYQHLPELSYGPHYVVVGDNLAALEYIDTLSDLKFKFIYIDPPYNSGSKLSYNDSRTRKGNVDPVSLWLNFMVTRLKLAHRVLDESGYIFISIDDRQHAELTLLMHEIFGRENHVGTIKWRKKRKASFLDQHFSTTIEYILVYAKNAKKAPRLLGEETTEQTRPVLNASNAVSRRILRKGTPCYCADGIYKRGTMKNRTLQFDLLDDMTVANGKLKKDVRVAGQFRVSQAVLDRTVFVTKNLGLRRALEKNEQLRKHATDDGTAWPTNEDGEQELREHFKTRVFTYPKPVGLIKNLLLMMEAQTKQPFYCLDFFAGSGTLAEAVLAANAEDKGNRRFFCIQSDEPLSVPIREESLLTIADVTCTRARKVHKKWKDKHPLEMFELKSPIGK